MNYYQEKNCNLQIKDISEGDGIISGYFASFGNKDSDGDIITKGAFKKTISENGPQSHHPRIKHLLDHDTTKVIGVIQELKEDDRGLYYVSKLGNHTLGRDALHMAKDGIITEHSIGFQTIKSREDKEQNASMITEIKLWEGSSLQTWGANSNTPLDGVKSLKEKGNYYIERINTLTKALRKGDYSDSGFEMLEIQLKQIQELVNQLICQSVEAVVTESSNKDLEAVNYLKQILN